MSTRSTRLRQAASAFLVLVSLLVQPGLALAGAADESLHDASGASCCCKPAEPTSCCDTQEPAATPEATLDRCSCRAPGEPVRPEPRPAPPTPAEEGLQRKLQEWASVSASTPAGPTSTEEGPPPDVRGWTPATGASLLSRRAERGVTKLLATLCVARI